MGQITVTGGSDGVTANCDEIVAMAARFGGVAHDTLAAAFTLHGYLANPHIALSALVDPIGYAAFETQLLLALDGWQGLSWSGAACGGIDIELRLAATAYETADRLAVAAHDAVFGAVAAPIALGAGAVTLARTGDPVRAAEAIVGDDPELADTLIMALGLPELLAATARAIPDGHGVVRDPGLDTIGVAGTPPRNLKQIIEDLAQRDLDIRHGEIDVRVLALPDGSRRAIVDITGTKSWNPLPTSDVTNLATNGRAIVGERTAYEDGVLAAMHRAGVLPTDPVMLVGHSQGGLIAINAARDAVRSGEFNVTHVVTAGAPAGQIVGALPSSVQVLALENSRDLVPHLDGVMNPDLPNVTTASAATGDGTLADDHLVDTAYVPLAAAVQASGDKSIRDFLSGADGYFRATTVETHTYQIQRSY